MGISGEGSVVIYVYDSNDFDRGDTVSYQVSFEAAVAIDEIDKNEMFSIYPNPASDVLKISVEGYYSGSIFNSAGKKVRSLEGTSGQSINISNLESGVYFITCQNASGHTFRKQFIKKY